MKHINFIILLFVVLILLKKQLEDFEVNDNRYNVVNNYRKLPLSDSLTPVSSL